jgi:hypothetical protein
MGRQVCVAIRRHSIQLGLEHVAGHGLVDGEDRRNVENGNKQPDERSCNPPASSIWQRIDHLDLGTKLEWLESQSSEEIRRNCCEFCDTHQDVFHDIVEDKGDESLSCSAPDHVPDYVNCLCLPECNVSVYHSRRELDPFLLLSCRYYGSAGLLETSNRQ